LGLDGDNCTVRYVILSPLNDRKSPGFSFLFSFPPPFCNLKFTFGGATTDTFVVSLTMYIILFSLSVTACLLTALRRVRGARVETHRLESSSLGRRVLPRDLSRPNTSSSYPRNQRSSSSPLSQRSYVPCVECFNMRFFYHDVCCSQTLGLLETSPFLPLLRL